VKTSKNGWRAVGWHQLDKPCRPIELRLVENLRGHKDRHGFKNARRYRAIELVESFSGIGGAVGRKYLGDVLGLTRQRAVGTAGPLSSWSAIAHLTGRRRRLGERLSVGQAPRAADGFVEPLLLSLCMAEGYLC
jgi:hypothetical protein